MENNDAVVEQSLNLVDQAQASAPEDMPEEPTAEPEKPRHPAEPCNTQTQETAQEPTPTEEAPKLPPELAEAQDKIAKLSEEKRILYEQLLRRQAEFENFRKRVERERADFELKVRADIISNLLPILDNFERAINSANLSADDSNQESFLTGVKLIYRQFLDCLSSFGLTPVKAVGETFDPHIHDAVSTEVNPELPENTILEELRRGYKLGDKLIRPSMVKVCVKS
ncbi:MAG: nucleotide exchange factor GrpE [Acidobacteriota bacterium]|nr:nucleotide exchange factor GrpE [Blastocatellia bacterium]MDW8411416.1 nucleotide exchange factor GrpE [Acidobacteriota bacterium]